MIIQKILSNLPIFKNTAIRSHNDLSDSDRALHGVTFRRRVIGFSFLSIVGGVVLLFTLDAPPPANISENEDIEASQLHSPQSASGKITPGPDSRASATWDDAPLPQPNVEGLSASASKRDDVALEKKILEIQNVASVNRNPPSVKAPAPAANNLTVPAEAMHQASTPQKDPLKAVIQVAALSSEDKAKSLQWKLKGVGLKSYTEKASTIEGDLVRVRIGPFASSIETSDAMRRLAVAGLSGKIVSD